MLQFFATVTVDSYVGFIVTDVCFDSLCTQIVRTGPCLCFLTK